MFLSCIVFIAEGLWPGIPLPSPWPPGVERLIYLGWGEQLRRLKSTLCMESDAMQLPASASFAHAAPLLSPTVWEEEAASHFLREGLMLEGSFWPSVWLLTLRSWGPVFGAWPFSCGFDGAQAGAALPSG